MPNCIPEKNCVLDYDLECAKIKIKPPRDQERLHESNNLGPSAVGAAAWMSTSKVAAQHIWVFATCSGPCHPWKNSSIKRSSSSSTCIKRSSSRLQFQNSKVVGKHHMEYLCTAQGSQWIASVFPGRSNGRCPCRKDSRSLSLPTSEMCCL